MKMCIRDRIDTMDEKEVSEMQEEMMTVLVVEPMKAPYVKNLSLIHI